MKTLTHAQEGISERERERERERDLTPSRRIWIEIFKSNGVVSIAIPLNLL